MSVAPRDGLDAGAKVSHADLLRRPRRILLRALLAGMSAGGVLGALVILPDCLDAQFAAQPGTAYSLTWSGLLIAVPVGALVGFMPALLATLVWIWQHPKGARRARILGSGTAALTVVATAAVLQLLPAVLLVVGAAVVSFATAYVLIPVVTTRARKGGTRSR